MTPLAAAGKGGLAGLMGAALAHALAVLIGRHGGAGWLRGSYGPPFFQAALYTAVFYAAIGAAAGRKAAAIGLLGPLLGMCFPLFVLTRYGGWSPLQWSNVMIGVYAVVLWSTIAGIGAASASGKAWRAAAAAMLGSLAAYFVQTFCVRFVPGLTGGALVPIGAQAESLKPSLVNLLDGLLSGAGLCLALSLDARLSRRPA